jgi:membrane protein
VRAVVPSVTVLVERGTTLVHWLLDPLVRVNFIDRSLALGAQAFGALIPLLIVVQAAEPGDASLAEDLVDRFGLSGAAADTVRTAFSPPTDQTTITALGVVVLVVSALSFTRRLQRLFEDTWSLPSRGVRGTGWGLAWIACFAVYGVLHPALDSVLRGPAAVVTSLTGALMVGLVTPYVLLGRRVAGRRLLLQAALTAVGLTALGVWTAIYMPHAIGSSAASYGVIGVAFAMLTWLWGLGIVLVCAAVYGSPEMDWGGWRERTGKSAQTR